MHDLQPDLDVILSHAGQFPDIEKAIRLIIHKAAQMILEGDPGPTPAEAVEPLAAALTSN